MVINWPMTWSPAARQAGVLIGSGEIGRVLEVRWRGGHMGPLGTGVSHAGVDEGAAPMTGPERAATWWHQAAAGGGAVLDFCCYGAMAAQWYIDEPAVAAMGMRANLASQWGDADDNGAMLVRFPGAMGIFEGSWTSRHHGVPSGPIVYGTEGTLVVESRDGKPVVRVERGSGDTKVYDAVPLPEGRRQVPGEFIHHLETGDLLHTTLDVAFNLEVLAILDAGVRSATSGKQETVDSPAWCVG